LLAAADPVGDPVLIWRAAEQLGIAAAAADAAEAQGLLTIGERVNFRHPLVRSAVYRSALAEERRVVHVALAKATDRNVDPDRRAWHLAAAADGPNEDVAVELERSAGRAQARGGLAAAAAFLRRAVALTDDPERRVDRALAGAEANLQAGQFDVAHSLVATAETGPLDELQRAYAELLRGQIAMFSSFGSDAPTLLLKAARRLERLDASLARDTYLDAWGAALMAGSLGSNGALLAVSSAAMSAPRPDGPPRPSDLLLDGLATLITEGGAAAPLLEEATRMFADERFVPEASLRWRWLTVVPSYALWDEESNQAIISRQLRAVRDAGALARLPLDLATLTLVAVRCGEFADAAAAIAEAEALSEATGARLSRFSAMMLAVLRGRQAEAEALIESARREASDRGQGVALHVAQWMAAVLSNAVGRYAEAVAAARDAVSDRSQELFGTPVWTAVELVEAATRSDNPDAVRIALERIAAATALSRTDSALGILARSRALASDGKSAEALYQEAIERLDRTRLRPELARAHLLYGEWLRREGRRVDARAELRLAHEQLTTIGMEAFAERARRELVATGEKLRKRTVETREDLTPQEAQIARLARDGLSNAELGGRLFISPHTVAYHLRKIFNKLGITSRSELSQALPSAPDAVLAS
jgi:DNA-binding CsgD family transcriptional regulator